MSVSSESASHSTLASAVSNWNLQRDGLDIRPVDRDWTMTRPLPALAQTGTVAQWSPNPST